MKLLSRPAFYVIGLLIAIMLLLTSWMKWKLDTLPKGKVKQEPRAEPVSISQP